MFDTSISKSIHYMKATVLVTALFFFLKCLAQKTTFGVSGGLLNGGERFKQDNSSASSADTGFYVGAFSKIPISEKLAIQPEINYGNLNQSNFGFVSARINYGILPKFYLQAGPEVSHIFESLSNTLNKTGINATFGFGYEVTNKFHLQARYSAELTNRIQDNAIDGTSRINWLFVGMGYSF